MTEKVYWLWLQKCIGFARSFKETVEWFENPCKVYNATNEERKACPFLLHKAAVREKMKTVRLEDFAETLEICRKHNIHIITPDDERYPKRLRSVECAPAVLYVRGDAECLNSEFPVAVIGSRTPSVYGEESAREIVKGLVRESEALIVSGGALGIDTVSHRTAIENGGKTVLVLGHGHGYKYLSENSKLRKDVFFNGAIISEYPPYTPVGHSSFHDRNRIISGMSKGVVIIEAAERSGTFSTANYAYKQKKDLFVLPGDIKSGNFDGSNRLISEGAKAVFASDDIIGFYSGVKVRPEYRGIKNNAPFSDINKESVFSKKAKNKNKNSVSKKREKNEFSDTAETKDKIKIKKLPETVSKNAEIVYNLMSDGKCTLDELAGSSELLPAKILAALTELELETVVEKTADAYRLITE